MTSVRTPGTGTPTAPDVKLAEEYTVAAADVFLTVGVGEGQFGTTDVLIGDTPVLRASGPIGHLRLGRGRDLGGKTLLVRTIVNDVSTLTNRMSVRYQLTGGAAKRDVVSRGTVTQQGHFLIFEAAFSLVRQA